VKVNVMNHKGIRWIYCGYFWDTWMGTCLSIERVKN